MNETLLCVEITGVNAVCYMQVLKPLDVKTKFYNTEVSLFTYIICSISNMRRQQRVLLKISSLVF